MLSVKTNLGPRRQLILLVSCLLPLFVAACGRVQVGALPGPPTLPHPTRILSPTSMPTALPTRVARVVTVVPEPTGTRAVPTSTASVITRTGTLHGTLCYPSEFIPAMRVYLENVDTQEITAVLTARDQVTFAVELQAGSYVAYAHPIEYPFSGGAYSHAVPCGLQVACMDHRLLPFTIRAGETNEEVQICDWYAPEAVPPPPDPEQVRQVTPIVTPTPTAALVATLPSGALVMEAKVGHVGVLPHVEEAPIYSGPGEAYARVGQIPEGRSVPVTGVSADGAWWRVP